jgi:hypothetical protein
MTTSWAQHTIEGVVLSTDDSLGLPGVYVILDSLNETITDETGKFKIEIEEVPSSLIFSYIGYLQRTVTLTSWSDIKVFLKPYVLKHYYDSQKIGFYLQSGLINNPIGGKIYLTTPYFLNSRLLKGSITYQTNLNDNRLLNGTGSFDNIIHNRYLGVGLCVDYLDLSLGDNYNLLNRSIEIDFWSLYSPIDLAVGFSNLRISNDEVVEDNNGLVITVGRYFHKLFKLDASTKFWIYKDLFGFQFQLNRSFRRFNINVGYQQLDKYKEANVGVGYLITYKFSDPNKY